MSSRDRTPVSSGPNRRPVSPDDPAAVPGDTARGAIGSALVAPEATRRAQGPALPKPGHPNGLVVQRGRPMAGRPAVRRIGPTSNGRSRANGADVNRRWMRPFQPTPTVGRSAGAAARYEYRIGPDGTPERRRILATRPRSAAPPPVPPASPIPSNGRSPIASARRPDAPALARPAPAELAEEEPRPDNDLTVTWATPWAPVPKGACVADPSGPTSTPGRVFAVLRTVEPAARNGATTSQPGGRAAVAVGAKKLTGKLATAKAKTVSLITKVAEQATKKRTGKVTITKAKTVFLEAEEPESADGNRGAKVTTTKATTVPSKAKTAKKTTKKRGAGSKTTKARTVAPKATPAKKATRKRSRR